MSRLERRLLAAYEPVRRDIFKFCEAMGFKPTWQQRQLLELVQRRSKRIACKSGQGPGKTTVSVIIALWWVLGNYGTKVIVTAPTMRQCKDVWLAEARRLIVNADKWIQKVVKIQTTRIVIGGNKDWGIQTMTATTDEAAQGFHEKNLKVICEEASGISRKLIQQFKGTLSNPNSAMLMIGNPNTRDCEFFDCFNRKRSQWATLTFNAEETPASEWFDPQRNRDLEEEFDRDSDVYRIRVLGEFPHSDPNCVISSEQCESVSKKRDMLAMAKLSGVKQFGIDLARFGGDESVIYRRSGESIVQWKRFARVDPSIVIEKAIEWQASAGWEDHDCWYVPDAGGIGQGIMHRFYDMGRQVLEFHNGSSAIRSDRYANKVTEAWFNFAKKVKAGRCYIPSDNMLIQQLSGRQYYVNRKGQLVLESKEEYKKRGNESPDRADGCVMAFYDDTVAAAGSVSGGYGGGKRVGM